MLSQLQGGQERFIGTFGKSLGKSPAHRYGSVKGEMWAVYLALKNFRHILRYKPFVLRTDSQAIALAKGFEDESGGARRWVEYLRSFECQTVHISGKSNVMADAISRRTDLPDMDVREQTELAEEADTINEVSLLVGRLSTEEENLLMSDTLDSSDTMGFTFPKQILQKIQDLPQWILPWKEYRAWEVEGLCPAREEEDTYVRAVEGETEDEMDGQRSGLGIETEVTDPTTIGATSFVTLQDRDPMFGKIKEYVRTKIWPDVQSRTKLESDYYAVRQKLFLGEQGLLKYKNTRFCVPNAYQLDIIKGMHTLGHLGVRQTRAQLERHYFWPGMRGAVEEFVR